MKYLKTYEGLFDFFKKKKKEPINLSVFSHHSTDIDEREFLDNSLDDVRDCFLEVRDEHNLNLGVIRDENKISVGLWKPGTENDEMAPDYDFIKLEDLMETFRFTDSYIKDLGLKIHKFELFICGYYDNTYYRGNIYYDSIQELERDLDKEGTKHIQSIEIIIIKL
jgi:hypothetical protein